MFLPVKDFRQGFSGSKAYHDMGVAGGDPILADEKKNKLIVNWFASKLNFQKVVYRFNVHVKLRHDKLF